MSELPDLEFVNTLRAAVVAYLESVDRWEAAYRKYYRMPDRGSSVSSDMEPEQREFEARRRALKLLLPRAGRLCHRYDLRNPFVTLLRTSLGGHAAQHRTGSAVGRNERNVVADCLVQLAARSGEWTPEVAVPSPPETQQPPAPTPRMAPYRKALMVGGACGVVLAIGIVAAMRPAPVDQPQPPAASPQEPPRQPNVPAVPVPPPAPTAKPGATRFYRMEGQPLTHWGDYGDILQHGMTAHLERAGNLLSLERTGPYMPPITFPGVGDVVVNAVGRSLLEASGLTGFTFQPVHKARIVELRWQEWDLKARRPPEYPESDEPEDYILERPPNARIAAEMGDIWEVVVPITAKIGRPREMVKSLRELYVERASWNRADVFRGDGYGGPLVTERAKAWLEEYFKGYVRFDEFASR